MNCFRCNDVEMSLINTGLYRCPSCGLIFDKAHADKTEQDLLEKGFISMANLELAEEWFNYFKSNRIFHSIIIIRYGIGQYLYINEKGRKEVLKHITKSKEILLRELAEVETALTQLNELGR